MYRPTQKSLWTGRSNGTDGEAGYLWHHVIQLLDLSGEIPKASGKNIALLGFCTDEGVRRNFGRVGAKEGPAAIRKALCNLAVHFDSSFTIFYAGDVVCENQELEETAEECALKMQLLLSKGYFPILLGGGHEISYSHFKGATQFLGRAKVGMINLDAHFDLRTYADGQHSGSWARQLLEDAKSAGENFNYLPIGINPAVNNRALFQVMSENGQETITLQQLSGGLTPEVCKSIHSFIDKVEHVCLTLDLDVISGAHAPGVSAPAAFGFTPELTLEIIREVLKSGKVTSIDIAEFNPAFDDGRTAKLAAQMVYAIRDLVSN